MGGAAASSFRPLFVSWRWQLLVPLFALLMVGAMVGAYLLADLPQLAETNALAADARLQLARLLLSAVAAGVVIVVFISINLFLGRVNRVTDVVQALASGDRAARTGMTPTDDIGALGQAIDRYADSVQERQDELRASLRRQRRETEHLTSVLESLPDGVIVQDLNGHAIMVNERAREWLGGSTILPSNPFHAFTAAITDHLGPAVAPGLVSVGAAQRLELNGRTLSAQAAAVMSVANQRVGTVIILRDVSEDAQRERIREAMIDQMALEVYAPLSELGKAAAGDRRPLGMFARQISRQSVALQKLIVELRELTVELDTEARARRQRPLSLDKLVWALANEWRQVAQASNLAFQMTVEQSGLYVQGDERRLRWAIGNLIDNAVKYTPPGGTISLELSSEVQGRVYLRVKDTGVGIAPAELPQVFARFFRGKPMTSAGREITAPGTGQGLSIARDIIEAQGGTVKIKSTLYVGTAVYVSLPTTAPVAGAKDTHSFAEMEGETMRLTTPVEARKG